MRHAVHGPREGRVSRARSLRKAFESARQAAKVERFTWHDMRHSFASWWVMRGGNLQVLQAVLWHSSLSMTRRDAHLTPGHVRAEMTKTEKSDAHGADANLPSATPEGRGVSNS
jgi:site-specific recombinase XerD